MKTFECNNKQIEELSKIKRNLFLLIAVNRKGC